MCINFLPLRKVGENRHHFLTVLNSISSGSLLTNKRCVIESTANLSDWNTLKFINPRWSWWILSYNDMSWLENHPPHTLATTRCTPTPKCNVWYRETLAREQSALTDPNVSRLLVGTSGKAPLDSIHRMFSNCKTAGSCPSRQFHRTKYSSYWHNSNGGCDRHNLHDLVSYVDGTEKLVAKITDSSNFLSSLGSLVRSVRCSISLWRPLYLQLIKWKLEMGSTGDIQLVLRALLTIHDPRALGDERQAAEHLVLDLYEHPNLDEVALTIVKR